MFSIHPCIWKTDWASKGNKNDINTRSTTTTKMYLVFVRNEIIRKLPESGVGNITEFREAEDHWSPQGEGDLPPPQMK